MLALNFPWIGRNPYRIGLLVCLVFGVVMLPLALTTSRGLTTAGTIQEALLPVGLGVLFLLVSLAVRQRLHQSDRELESHRHATYCADCLMVHGTMQVPATLAIADGTLLVKPLFGPAVTVPLAHFAGVKSSRWFNGQYLFRGAGGFLLSASDGKRFGIAVPDATRFASHLRSGSTAA